MAHSKEPSFDKVADRFLEGYASQVNGYIRYKVIQQNLVWTLPELTEKTLNLIDIGAGDGREARWLTSLGHEVTAVDPSSTMVDKMKEEYKPKVSSILHGDAGLAMDKFGEASFDGVFSHGVLPYFGYAGKHINDLSDLVRTNGFISLLTKGFDGTLLRYTDQRLFREMADYIETKNYVVQRLGEKAMAHRPEEIEEFFQMAGIKLVDWFGVTVITDNVEDKAEELEVQDLTLLLEQELALSRNENTRGMGQMLHFIGRKINT